MSAIPIWKTSVTATVAGNCNSMTSALFSRTVTVEEVTLCTIPRTRTGFADVAVCPKADASEKYQSKPDSSRTLDFIMAR
jgi:hypothetical protein